jgi:outer membrane protein TolC
MIKKSAAGYVLIVVAAAALSGCGNYEGARIRKEHAEAFRKSLDEKTYQVLPAGKKLGLRGCVEIGLRNNLQVRSSEIGQRIAKLERQVSFSYFLPQVALDYQYTRFDPQPEIIFGSSSVAMQDARVREISWGIQQSIFDPSTWFLYSMYSRGEEIAELVTEYTRQMTVFQITAFYFNCLTLTESVEALESQISAAAALAKELSAFEAEGLVSRWQAEQAQVLLLARETELSRTKRALAEAKADLLSAMGLSPLAEVFFDVEMPLQAPQVPVEELVFEALVSNRQMQISDREVAIEKEKVKTAIFAFLPRLGGFASRTYTSDSYLKYGSFWATGVSGVLTVFDGFANINEYKAAKERRTQAYVNREQAALTLMVQVLKADLGVKDAQEQMVLSEKSLDAVSSRFREVEHQWREGLVDFSEMLSVLAEKDDAEMALMSAGYRLQVSIATLQNVMGLTNTEIGEGEDER